MGGAHDLVVLPALSVAVFPTAVFIGGDAVAVGEGFWLPFEEREAVEEEAHLELRSDLGVRRSGRGKVFDVVEKAALAGVDGPGHDDADHVEGEESPQRAGDAARQGDRRAVGFGDEKGPVGGDGGGESGDGRRFLFRLSYAPWRPDCGSSRAISLRMMLGIIWKVEALPTPVIRNRNRKLPKKP